MRAVSAEGGGGGGGQPWRRVGRLPIPNTSNSHAANICDDAQVVELLKARVRGKEKLRRDWVKPRLQAALPTASGASIAVGRLIRC